jgi:glyoxylase-like metal-dependent hydrolase (beta-lactamase superfamily II)
MFGVFKNSIFPPYSDDAVKMIESWGKLINSGCSIFLPGHGKEIKRSLLEKEYSEYSRKYKSSSRSLKDPFNIQNPTFTK